MCVLCVRESVCVWVCGFDLCVFVYELLLLLMHFDSMSMCGDAIRRMLGVGRESNTWRMEWIEN